MSRSASAATTALPTLALWGSLLVLALTLQPALPPAATLVGLYCRLLKQEDALDNPNRLRVYEAIRAEAGIRAGTIQKKLGLNYGTVLCHLHALERARLIEGAGAGQRRYFAHGSALCSTQKQRIAAASAPAARAILDHLRRYGETSLSNVATTLGISLSTASATVSRLERNGMLVKRRAPEGVRISFRTPAEAPHHEKERRSVG